VNNSKNFFYLKTFGCQMNERDSEIMAHSLENIGYIETSDIDSADLVILNTCSIRAKAQQKVLSFLGNLRKKKINNPAMKICVAGCVAQQEGWQLIEKMQHVDLVLGTQHIYEIADLVKSPDGKNRVVTELRDNYVIPRFLATPRSPSEPPSILSTLSPSRFVTIMQGCNNFCTYCVVPHTRGREISRNYKEIIEEITVLVESGVREITLLGQNVNSYGKANRVADDSIDYDFTNLLYSVSEINGLKRLRFTTSNPKDLSDRLMRCFSDIKILCPQFHLPVQSGSDKILRLMNRKYSREEYLRLVEKLHAYCPEIALTTDIIVGFPGEEDVDFLQTMDLLERVRFHGSFSFKYSDRPGTKAKLLDNKVDEATKSTRLQIFQARQDIISLERNSEYIEKVKEVMIEAVDNNGVRGRTNTNHIVHFLDETMDCKVGDFVSAKIIIAGQHSLQGILYNGN
jgi:tRNA-2-methylthio-N6-dimethylallyladenosine synthase